jgi:GNAT superfamily N-acetyltransferase
VGALQVRPAPMDGPDATVLLAELDEDLTGRYGGGDPVRADPSEFTPPGGYFAVALVDGRPQACAGYRRLDERTAELKRMYVRPPARGRGVARLLLAELERAAAAAGYAQLWLETGLSQPEAMALYESAGYRRIPAFGQYAGFSDQRCFAKSLASAGG